METFIKFAKRMDPSIDTTGISQDVALASTNYSGYAGVWRVGLFEEATHNGHRISGSPSTVDYSKNRGRCYRPSRCCLEEMVAYARLIS